MSRVITERVEITDEMLKPSKRLIDSDAVIKAIDKHTFDTDDGLCLDDDITCILEEVPTIEERKTGKWERAYLDHEAMGERPSIFYCSVCNQCIAYPVNYCPSCGARMHELETESRDYENKGDDD